MSILITAWMEDEVESPHTLPSLSSDRKSSLDVDVDRPSLPLPPSSPPMFPVNFSVSIIGLAVFVWEDSSPVSSVPDDEDEIKDVPRPALDDM